MLAAKSERLSYKLFMMDAWIPVDLDFKSKMVDFIFCGIVWIWEKWFKSGLNKRLFDLTTIGELFFHFVKILSN